MDLSRNKKIQKQVEKWDLYARLMPTAFLVSAIFLALFDLVSTETIIYVGLAGFAFTAVTWWWWAIFTIKYLISALNRANKDLYEVTEEVVSVAEELQELKNDT